MQSSGRSKIGDVNDYLTCVLCKGYYIDATTIIECLHSFCRTCIVRYLQTNKYCPICDVQVHKTRPLLNIRSDQTLQDIVYKVVPGLFKNEMKRRRDFYSQETALVKGSIPTSSEKRGDEWGCDRLIFNAEDIVSVSLEYCPESLQTARFLPAHLQASFCSTESLNSNNDAQNQTHRRYLRCPAAISVYHLKKFLRAKYGLNQNQKLKILYMHDNLKDEYTLVDLAYVFSWKRNGPLRLFYKLGGDDDTDDEDDDEEEESNPIVTNIVSKTLEKVEGVKLEVNVTDPAVASASSSMDLLSADAAMATAPASRHPSPPPSPQMATEPNYVKIDKPNSAALLNEQAAKMHDAMTHKTNLKSVLSPSKHLMEDNVQNLRPYVSLPILKNVDSYKRPCYANSISTNTNGEAISEKNKTDVPKKKTVTFSVDLVQTFYDPPRYKSSKHSPRGPIFRTSKVNKRSVINTIKHGILITKRS